MKTDLNYCIVLSSEQLAYLAGSRYGIDRMKILHRLIEAAVLKETGYTTKGFSTTLQVGQAVLSEVDLSSKSGYDKKTISRVLDKMNQLGIVASTQNNRTSVHTLKCISAWMQDGNRIDNPFYVRLKDRQGERKDMLPMTDDATHVLPMASQDNVNNHIEGNFPNSKDGRQNEVIADVGSSDVDFPSSDEIPIIPDKGEQFSSSFPFVSVSPQLVAEEESGEDISDGSQV